MIAKESIEGLKLDDPDYPLGLIVDALTDDDPEATEINSDFHNDWHSTFQRAVELTNTIPNGTKDGDAEYQLHGAMFGTDTVTIQDSLKYRYESGGKVLRIYGGVNNTTGSILNYQSTTFSFGTVRVDGGKESTCVGISSGNPNITLYARFYSLSPTLARIDIDSIPDGYNANVNFTIPLS